MATSLPPNLGIKDNEDGPQDTSNQTYIPVETHWFHNLSKDSTVWYPFSKLDSQILETAWANKDTEKMIATDGGRHDVKLSTREKFSVYWTSNPTQVRRCSWFFKSTSDGRYQPFEESLAERLESEYKKAFESNHWNHKVELIDGQSVEFHGPDALVVIYPAQSADTWGNNSKPQRSQLVKRGMSEFDILDGEPTKVDHVLFMVHGIGSVCDLQFRKVEEVVDECRSMALQLVESHYQSSCQKGLVGRIEVLPISWHDKLHSAETGIDEKLQSITLKSIPRLRHFTNDTILDVLFYTSPVYCQTIVSSVGNELNRIYDLFKIRNPSFNGGVSLGGHSLGSLILFDLLGHQHAESVDENEDVFPPMNESKPPPPLHRRISRRISYMMSSIGTGQPQINYPHLSFQPKAFFALGSPIGMFVTVRGLNGLGESFALPTCPGFFNIFHPYDPVAYRVESLINPELGKLNPVLIPHHKGRKRMHLEFKETMARVGADLKQRVIDSMKTTLLNFYPLGGAKSTPTTEPEEEIPPQQETEPTDIPMGLLNGGRRIDYVLQEGPLEWVNEYLFALTSHVCYWRSEDTMLLIIKEIYNSLEISPDIQIPQQTMTIERTPQTNANPEGLFKKT